jgi:hypothetical protein
MGKRLNLILPHFSIALSGRKVESQAFEVGNYQSIGNYTLNEADKLLHIKISEEGTN